MTSATDPRTRDVLVVIGVGGMGEAIARREGTGRTVVLADFSEAALDRVGGALRGDGFEVVTRVVDVSSRGSVAELADAASVLGRVTQVVHTAGLSPVQATRDAILAVDLLGTAHVLDEFERVIAPGGAGLVIASMAGHFLPPLPPEVSHALATTPSDELLALPVLASIAEPASAYSFAKHANHLRVRAASAGWGAKGARVNSISPGVISTPMGQQELAGESGAQMRAMIDASGTGRVGTPYDIADAAAFLLGPDASFVTGTDLLVDGGVVAAVSTGRLDLRRGR
ncbi:NAD(P)-dependent dehydrogenase (short-subunit alcohol dehydrogenase family) [Agromyces hippuratus]|uniref:NAD(P)-dependent dehydrogenase (Short-subunit alcohol dehydrogenase family) n=1 Tax=Agromyces hippuratus TaxID=286438 RepID=A0A852X713_9MICO|nr:SDR family oxidoreductase [Agromyces hippuratus]NYG21751.1 NAD(P)-dependent dehydrogenase (short-subunit alcohol dehydrogenase family) [Agromyces hippuratus]